MAVDRDLAVAFVAARYPPGASSRRAWEMLAATGARGLRIARETGRFAEFVLTELRADAAEVARANAEGLPGVEVRVADATRPIARRAFDYVDVDPYGSPAPFLGAALAAVADGGTFAVTATDMMVLAGAQRGACERRYGASPVRGRLGPEGGLRILLAYAARRAAEEGRTIRPLLAYVLDHHVRAYLEVGRSVPGAGDPPVGILDPAGWDGPPLPPGRPVGPLWLGSLFDPELVAHLGVPTTAAHPVEVDRLLARFRDEARVPAPFYYEPNLLAERLRLCSPPPLRLLLEGLAARGHPAARTHAREAGFRTAAPRATVDEVARAAERPA